MVCDRCDSGAVVVLRQLEAVLSNSDRTARIVTKHWPSFVDMIGDEVTHRIVDAVAEGTDPRELYRPEAGGEPFDFYGLIGLIGAAAGMVQFGLEVYDRIRGRSQRPPTVTEIRIELVREAQRRQVDEEISEVLDEVAESIVRDEADEDGSERAG